MLYNVLWSEKGLAHLSGIGCGWNDGGCWTLAEALRRYLKDVEMYCVYDAAGNPQHVVTKIPSRNLFIDGNGIVSEAELIRIMIEEESITGPITVEPFKSQYCVATPNGIELWKEVSQLMETFLEDSFGDGTRFLCAVCEAR